MKLNIFAFALAALSLSFVTAKDTSLVCGDSSSSEKVSIVNPFAPPNVCTYTILPQNNKICQMRIDFSMILAQPRRPSAKNDLKVPECIDDYLLIGGFKLCGVEKSQHIYVPINSTAGMDSLDIIFNIAQRKGSAKLPPLSWNLKVTQLKCPDGVDLRSSTQRASAKNGFLLASAGCDQYYPDNKGIIQSFNYNDGIGIYPYNMNYVMCFRRTTATVGLLINVESFNLGHESHGITIFDQTESHCYPQVPSEGHVEDYLMIPQSQVQENGVRANYFCGQSLNGLNVLSTNPGPMMIIFNSGSVYKNGTKSQGFSLSYKIQYE